MTTPKLLSEENAGLRDFLWNTGMFDKLNHDDHVKLTRFISQQKQLYANEMLDRLKSPTINDVFPSKPYDGTQTYNDMLSVVHYYEGLIEAERTRNNQGKEE